MSPINQGLLITLIGMGLVFLAIILLWGLMVLIVRLGRDPEESGLDEPGGTELESQPKKRIDLKKRLAAAAAVAYALARRSKDNQPGGVSSDTQGNSWQTAQRAQVLQGKANIFTSRTTRR
jgi:Na+-transporting methylmalonyl-CoA/oxaloacetate decarboxylase gamma subunit